MLPCLKTWLVSGVLDDKWGMPAGFLLVPFSLLSLLGGKAGLFPGFLIAALDL
jgi:hypothetical protein